MLDQELKQAYQKITPSPELKHRVLSMQIEPQKQKRAAVLYFKPIMTVAACLVLLIGGVTVFNRMGHTTQTEILLQGETVLREREVVFEPETVEYTEAAVPRTASIAPAAYDTLQEGTAIDLQISFEKETLISVEQGMLCVGSATNGVEMLEQVGQSVSFGESDGVTLVRWVIPTTEMDREYRMHVGDDVICVVYRASTNEYLISRKNAET